MKAPKIDLKYGVLQNEEEWISWVKLQLKEVTSALETYPKSKEDELFEAYAKMVFDEVSQCGYEEGVDSERESNSWV